MVEYTEMVLREVKSLGEKQWKQLTDALDKGPTPEQRKFVKESVEYFKHLEEQKK